MPYLEQTSASAQLDAAEIVNLKRILQLCKVPDVGPSPLDSAVTPEIRYTNALTTLEKSTAVFDEAIFQDAVFMETLDEDACDAELLAAAKERGVPDEYLPSNCMRNMPQSPSSTILEFLNKKDLPPTPEETDDLIPDMRTDSGSSVRTTSTDLKHSSRPSLSLPFRKLSTRSSMSDATRPGTSSSFLSTFSKSSTPKSPGRVKPRSSFMSLFRSSQKSPPILGPSRLDQSGVWIPVPVPSTSDVHSLASKSDKASTASVTSPSISISSRTSASSFADLNQFSWLDSRTLQRCTKTAKFITLQVKCQSEAKRFVDFCQHQKVALPLFIGRSRMYLESRIEIRIADLKKKQLTAKEALENKHLMQEVSMEEEQAVKTAEESTKNATALKHMHRRISLLGERVTEFDLARLEDEKNALAKLNAKQERDVRNLHRIQYREKQDLEKTQREELEDFERMIREEYDEAVKVKEAELAANVKKLEKLIHKRSVRLVSRWWLMLQVWKKTEGERIMMSCGNVVPGPLPIGLLNLPEELGPYIMAFR